MRPLTPAQLERLRELVADEQIDQLSIEDRAELEELREQAGSGDRYDGAVAELTRRVGTDGVALPDDVRARLLARGQRLVASSASASPVAGRIGPDTEVASSFLPRLLVAASLLLACGTGYYAYTLNTERAAALATARQAEVELASVRASNTQLLAAAQSKAEELASKVRSSDARIAELDQKLAETAAREVRLARDLHDATQQLDSATLKIAKLEAPVDPLELAGNRRKLMEVPGTVRVAWAPFDLPDAPSEQREVRGDVVWNDDLKQGFLRFEGLKPNDPKTEQYQVWVIDERGMEQKVSGGVFNALASGEVVVPITPAIDVRKVALFAVTIEEPGGTWVPNLKRRVVVAPRGN
jgi:anti-sigma-K factor RskA